MTLTGRSLTGTLFRPEHCIGDQEGPIQLSRWVNSYAHGIRSEPKGGFRSGGERRHGHELWEMKRKSPSLHSDPQTIPTRTASWFPNSAGSTGLAVEKQDFHAISRFVTGAAPPFLTGT